MSYRTLLARVPFPNVPGTKAPAAALKRAIGQLPLAAYPLEPCDRRERRVSAVAQRAVLEVIARYANGAGFCFPRIRTIARESGYGRRTIFRALSALEAQGFVERFLFLRTPDRYSHKGLPPSARRGQGPNIYRIGASLRASAGLIEFEWTPGLPQRPQPGTARSVALPASASPGRCGTPPERTSSVGTAGARGTPRSNFVAGIVLSRSEGALRNGLGTRRAVADHPWHQFAARAAARQSTRLWAEALPRTERDFVLALVDELDAVLAEDPVAGEGT